jgi:hypothetical protein
VTYTVGSVPQIRLIVRDDDIGSSRAANVACIRSYRDGIVRSVEMMASAPRLNEAVRILQMSIANGSTVVCRVEMGGYLDMLKAACGVLPFWEHFSSLLKSGVLSLRVPG